MSRVTSQSVTVPDGYYVGRYTICKHNRMKLLYNVKINVRVANLLGSIDHTFVF